MNRLTTNKEVSEMGMYELAHNGCYIKEGAARYRDFVTDIDARELARELAYSLADVELSRDNDEFDEKMLDNLQYDITEEPIGLIALFYRNLWAMAELRERLKKYEDTGLEPEQISQMDEAYLEKCNEVNKLKIKETAVAAVITGHNNAINTDVGDCPKCGIGPLRACDSKYCPECGQRLRWK